MWPSNPKDHSFATAHHAPWRQPAEGPLNVNSAASAAAASAAVCQDRAVSESNSSLLSHDIDDDDDDFNANNDSTTIQEIIGRIIAAPAPALPLQAHPQPQSFPHSLILPTTNAAAGAPTAAANLKPIKDLRFFEATKRFKTPAFLFFSAVKQKEIRKQLQRRQQSNDKAVNVSKLVVKAWEKLGPAEKLNWEALARQEKANKYENETPLVVRDKIPKQPKPSSSSSPPKKATATTTSTAYAPARPLSAFLAFSNSRRASLQRDVMPNANYREVSKVLAVMWKEAPEAIRQHYFQEEAEQMKLYHAAMNQWKQQNSIDQDNDHPRRDNHERWQPEQLVSLLSASIHGNGKHVKDRQVSSTLRRALERANTTTLEMAGTTTTTSLQAVHKMSPARMPIGAPSIEALGPQSVRPGTAALGFDQPLAMPHRLDIRRSPVVLARGSRPGDLESVAKRLSRQQRLSRVHHTAAHAFHLIGHPIPPLLPQPPLALYPNRDQAALCKGNGLRMNGALDPLASQQQPQQQQQQQQQPSHTSRSQESVKKAAASSTDCNAEFVFFPSPFSNPLL